MRTISADAFDRRWVTPGDDGIISRACHLLPLAVQRELFLDALIVTGHHSRYIILLFPLNTPPPA